MRRSSWFAIAAAYMAFCGSGHAANLVQNGDFTGFVTGGVGQIGFNNNVPVGWSNTNPNQDYNFIMNDATPGSNGQYGNVALWNANNGGAITNTWDGLSSLGGAHNFLAMDGDFQTSAVQQTINGLHVGQTYTLTFDYGFSQQTGFTGPTQQNVTACVGGSCVTYPGGPNYVLPSHDFSDWLNASQSFTATSTSEVLSFLAFGDTIPPGGSQLPPFALISNVDIPGAPGPGPASSAAAVLSLLGLAYARRRSLRGQA